MRFRTRAFLLCFIPFALLLTGSFWIVQRLVQSTVRGGLRSSLRDNHVSIARVHAKHALQKNRFLKIVGENASLKAGMELLLHDPRSAEARLTVEDQLRELCQRMGFDFLMVSASSGAPLAGVLRENGQLVPVAAEKLPRGQNGLVLFNDRPFQIAAVPVDLAEENIGFLSVGESFDLSEFVTPSVLIRDGTVLSASLPAVSHNEIAAALRGCGGREECDIRLRGTTWLSLSVPDLSLGDGYVLRSLQNVDAATGPVYSVLQNLLMAVLIVAVTAALIFSFGSSRSIVRPIASVIAHLRITENTGLLPEFSAQIRKKALSPIREIDDLMKSFNRAAASIREARAGLQEAYVEFVGSLANALDARDQCTAGHSARVSDLSCAIARAMGLGADQIERIRIGALLHDIGKIGIPDAILQKPGRLTTREFEIVKQHPEIGRRILEGVHGFAPYLRAVELHHENWNGSGYPHGQVRAETPVDARIIHVSDAYDAMTSDRPYRSGLSSERAIDTLRECAGTQFDPEIVAVLSSLLSLPGQPASPPATSGIAMVAFMAGSI